MNGFPNWQTRGFKSKEEGMTYVFECIAQNIKKIISRGLTDEVVFQYGGQTVIFKGKKKKDAKDRKEDKEMD